MRLYETMLLIDARLDDEAVEGVIDRFNALVAEGGGTPDKTEKWGRRRLAYEIDDQPEGYYVVLTYNMEADKRAELERALPFLEGRVRSKTVRPEIRVRKA